MSIKKSTTPTILVFTKYFAPGYKAGGPVRTLENIIERLASDVKFRVVTVDRDMGDSEPYREVAREEWVQHKKGHVYYVPPKAITVKKLGRLVRRVAPDAIYLNSFFDQRFTQRILVARWLGLISVPRIIIAPRGEFSKGALRLKRIKKRAYLIAARVVGLYNGLIWHASTEREAEEIRAGFPPARRSNIEIARNLAPPSLSDDIENARRQAASNDAPLRVCFLSRLSPKKNLDFALRALANVRAPVRFTIYGPKEEEPYWEKCQAIVDAMPPNVSVVYEGSIMPHEVLGYLQQHDVFLFPTRGENYGHVIVEALSAGLYVIISDQTPWADLNEQGIGKVLALTDPATYSTAIESAARFDAETWCRVRRDATSYAVRVASDEEAWIANYRLFVGKQ